MPATVRRIVPGSSAPSRSRETTPAAWTGEICAVRLWDPCRRGSWLMPTTRFQPSSSMRSRSEEHTSELQSRGHLVCRLLLEKKKDAWTGPRAKRASEVVREGEDGA